MTDRTISVRVNTNTHESMKEYSHINWSAIIRKALESHITQLQKENKFDREKAIKAAKVMDEMRSSGTFKGGKSGAEIIREWRNKRKY